MAYGTVAEGKCGRQVGMWGVVGDGRDAGPAVDDKVLSGAAAGLAAGV